MKNESLAHNTIRHAFLQGDNIVNFKHLGGMVARQCFYVSQITDVSLTSRKGCLDSIGVAVLFLKEYNRLLRSRQ